MKPAPLSGLTASRRGVWACVGLAFVTLALYWQVHEFDFTNFDDPYYIYANPMVRNGLTLRGVLWALTTRFFDWWHPVMWWSHMLDCEVFGLKPGLHHLENVGLHIANTLLVFGVLWRMTGARLRSAVVAALFALHPLHVESVAWLAERKDVLSTLFWLLSLWAYVSYVKEAPIRPAKSRRYYLAALLLFVLGLMTKPMVLTLPFVLLLLDYWPLNRFGMATGTTEVWATSERSSLPGTHCGVALGRLGQLVKEKLPFFWLALMSAALTYFGMKSGRNILSGDQLAWSLRWANVPVSYARYLGKMIWPADLAVFYPMPTHWDFWQVGGAVLILVLITWLVLAKARSAPYGLFGWFLFLGMLVPVIGIIPAGLYAMADRYTYFPSVGLFVAVVWAVADASVRWPARSTVLGGVTALVLLAFSSVTWLQIQHWRNSFTLWPHCIAVTGENAAAQFQWGWALQEAGQGNEAIAHYREALRLKPDHLNANLNLGVALAAAGLLPEATNCFATALRIEPGYAKAHINMGNALYKVKNFGGATNHYAAALRGNPNDQSTRRVYSLTLIELGDFAGALDQASEATRLDPRDAWAHLFKGQALSALGSSDDAMNCYVTAVGLNPGSDEVHYHLGLEWLKRGKLDEAVASLREALRLNPASDLAHFELAVALAGQRKMREAVTHYREALRLNPDAPAALNNLAWILATCADADLRNGGEAVRLAERACEATSYKQTLFVGTLGAACAEAAQFEKAIEAAQKASDLARSSGQTNLFERNQELLRLFKRREAYREQD